MNAGYEPPPRTLICPKCRHANPDWRTVCERCQARLPRKEDSPPPVRFRAKRPGCITAWVLLFGAYALFSVMSYAASLAASAPFSAADLLVLVVAGLGMIVTAIVLVGVWRMEAWARIPAIVIQLALLAFLVISELAGSDAVQDTTARLSSAESESEGFSDGADVFGLAFWFAANAVYLYWFLTHRAAFVAPDADPAATRDPEPDAASDPGTLA